MSEQNPPAVDFDFLRFFVNHPLHLTVVQLAARGWTEGLVRRFLGPPDRWAPVDHWKNWRGKRLYHLGRVELAEGVQDFQGAFQASVGRRKLPAARVKGFLEERRRTRGLVEDVYNAWTPEEREYVARVERSASILEKLCNRDTWPRETRAAGRDGE